MTTPTPASARLPSPFWGYGGALGVHAALAALLAREPPPVHAPLAPARIEFRLQPRPQLPPREPVAAAVAVRRPPPPPSKPAQPTAVAMNLRAAARTPKPAAAPIRAAQAPAEEAGAPSAESRDLRSVDLLPSAVLRRQVEGSDPPSPPVSERDATHRLAQERVQELVGEEVGRYRAESGAVDPMWRDLERASKGYFQPNEFLVRSGHSQMTLGQRLANQISSVAKQIFMSPQNVEHGTLPRGEFAERGPNGAPEDSYRTGMAAQQAKAVQDAWGKPASWRRTEVRLVLNASGEVESSRIVSSCGIAKLDQVAKEAIEKAARARTGPYTGKRTVTRWAFESGYAANPPNQVGFRFDETGLINRNARGIRKYLSDPQYLVGGHIETRVSLLSLQETPGRDGIQYIRP